MNIYRADLHVHTVLSPCGDLEMSPVNIVQQAKAKGIDILGVTDHNSTKHAPLIKKLATKEGIMVLMGAEVTTHEEVHCLCFFETEKQLFNFQNYLERYLPKIKNNVNKFGYQVVVNEQEEIIEEEENLLISGLDRSIEQIEQKVHSLNGLFIPAHIDKKRNSIISQLGFVPFDLKIDALELSIHTDKKAFLVKNKYLQNYRFIQSSDAHYIQDIGKIYTEFEMEELSFKALVKALRKN